MTIQTPEIESRRQQLKLQQEVLLRGERPPPITPAEAPTNPPEGPPDRSYTQELSRNPGNQGISVGIQEALRNSWGDQEERTEGGADPAERGGSPRPGQAAGSGSSPEVMPLREYVLFAAEKNRQVLEDADGYLGAAFTFARYMMTHPDLEGLSSQDAADQLDELLGGVFPEAEDPWVGLLGASDSLGNPDDPFESFVHCWDTVKQPLGEAPLERAVRLAEEHPVGLPGFRSPRWKAYLRFISICRWLEVTRGGESFFVPVRTFAEILDVVPKTVSNYRKKAERDGFLVLVREQEGWREATEYRFNLDALGVQEPMSGAPGEWGEIE